MIQCPRCQSSNPPTAVSCSKCGTPFDFEGPTVAVKVLTPPAISKSALGEGWSVPSAPAGGASILQPGQTLGERYEILQVLGQGGMGAVYKAKDLELDRIVALKVVRPELAIQPEMLQRFKQELILAREITHRNVIRIFDLSVADGIKFITMEFIEGQDLKSLAKQKGKLTCEETAEIIGQVCLALEAAHEKHVVHRDLKPSNIMIDTHGRVAVMDFGIARSSDSEGMTLSGFLVGTPDYMSPEQVMGERVDGRSDLFTLGVILYEMLTGMLPYKGETGQSAMFRRTREMPKPPIEVDPAVPQQLSDITAKCLQIDPAKRYQSAREILNDLDAWRGGALRTSATGIARTLAPSSRKKWIIAAACACAVIAATWALRGRFMPSKSASPAASAPGVSLAILPFHNDSGDQSLDWLGTSVAETLSTDVGQSSRLHVVSQERVTEIYHDLRLTSDTSLDSATTQRLAEFTNADNLVFGRYARYGNQIRIDATVQNIKEGRSTSVSEAADENSVLTAIDRLARDIRSNLSLSGSAVKELEGQSFKPSTNSVPALRDYNEGLQLARGGKFLDAVKQFEASTQEDPNFALAYSELGQSYAHLGQDSDAERASQRAVELSENLPSQEKYRIQAVRYQILHDDPKAIDAYETLAKVSPNDTDVLFALGVLYERTGEYGKAREELSKVMALDPKSAAGLLESGRVEIMAGDPQKGLEDLARAQALTIESGNDEQRSEVLQAMGGAYSDLNKNEDAIRNYQESLEIKQKLGLKKGIAESLHAIANSQVSIGQPDQALKNYNAALDLRREIGDRAGTADVLNDLAAFYNDRGQHDQALKLFKESLQDEMDVGNQGNVGMVLDNIGSTYSFEGDYQNARTYYEQALEVREKTKVPGDIADTLHNLGDTLTYVAQYDQALQDYERALDLRRSGGDKLGAAAEYSSMGSLFALQGRYGAALSSERDALAAAGQEQGFWLADILGSYGHALAQVGRADEAEKNLQQALSIARQQKDEGQVIGLLDFEGDNAFYRGDYKSASSFYDQALEEASHTKDARMVLISKLDAAKVAVKQGRFQPASAALRSLAQQAGGMGLKYQATECSLSLGEALIGMKNFGPAKAELEDALNNSERLGLLALSAQAHFLLGRALELSGKAAESQDQYKQARQIALGIQKEAQTNAIAKRSDLSPIFARGA